MTLDKVAEKPERALQQLPVDAPSNQLVLDILGWRVSWRELLCGATYLPDLDVEVKSKASRFAVKCGEEGEEEGGNLMHLGQVGRLLHRDAGEETQAKLLTRQVKYF